MTRHSGTIIESTAHFSPCRQYRYTATRIWSYRSRPVMFIGLNPSTADEIKNDPTVTRCIKYAQKWGYGGLIMMNLFAYRATDPRVMKAQPEPVGIENNMWLKRCADKSALIIAAWGNHGQWLNRSTKVRKMLNGRLHYLKLNGSGEPAHPLYLKADLMPKKLTNNPHSSHQAVT